MDEIYILIPVYNVEAFLERCLQSVLNQTYTDYELVLIDDGSTDHSGDICDEYAYKYDNIKVLHHEHGGVSVTRNAGIEYVLGLNKENSWFTWIDSDDYVHPKYLEFLYKVAIEANTGISCCSYKRINQSEKFAELDDVEFSVYTPEELWVKDRTNALIPPGKLYKVELFQSLRYPAGKIYEDEFITYKVLFKETAISYVATPVLVKPFCNTCG